MNDVLQEFSTSALAKLLALQFRKVLITVLTNAFFISVCLSGANDVNCASALHLDNQKPR